MKAMILSAGFGTRLNPYTKNLPKALIPYKDIPMIDYQINKLKKLGVDEIVVNSHHHSEKIINYFNKNNFKIKISVIVEPEILGTGGGILNASKFFKNEKHFLIINVDAETDMDISKMIKVHESKKAFATLAVQKRLTERYLEFDSKMKLVGRENSTSDEKYLFAFNGIHIISDRIFEKGFEIKFKDILEVYFEVIKFKNEQILGYDVGKSSFKDLGRIENLFS